METQVKEKTATTISQKIENYLGTASKHLFLTEKGKFFKVFPVVKKEKLYYVTLEFDGKESNFVNIIDVGNYIDSYGNNAKHVLSDILFPPHVNKRESIPNFKQMKEKMVEINKIIQETFDGSNKEKVAAEIKKTLGGLEPKKKE